MPKGTHFVRKTDSKWAIVKKLPGGGTKVVGHSATKAKAEASARIRDIGSASERRRR